MSELNDYCQATPLCPHTEIVLLDESLWTQFVDKRAQRLLNMALTAAVAPQQNQLLASRPFLAAVLAETAQLEELLDAYGAQSNQRWCDFRKLLATARIFANTAYKLRHIQHSCVRYRLAEKGVLLQDACVGNLDAIATALGCCLTRFAEEAARLNLQVPVKQQLDFDSNENLPPGILPCDRKTRHVDSARQVVLHLATAFLDVAARSVLLHTTGEKKTDISYCQLVPDPVSEENLLQLESLFHSLQALYDTYISTSDMEEVDADLPVLRGHISVIYHLVEIARSLVHYYERHMAIATDQLEPRIYCAIDAERILAIVIDFALAFAWHYLSDARQLCQRMLKRYAHPAQISVQVPSYRGFHVRPATLISRIVRHYGSTVTMEMAGQKYDAGSPLELFRANELINSEKRRNIAEAVANLPLDDLQLPQLESLQAVRRVVLMLAERDKIILYRQPLPLDQIRPMQPNDDLLDYIVNSVKQLFLIGVIDFQATLIAGFAGDSRVLDDIRHLAEAGYGEDHFGNNIPLPPQLTYLRRD